MSGPEDNPIDDHKPTKEEWEAAMSKDESTHGAGGTMGVVCFLADGPACGRRPVTTATTDGTRITCHDCLRMMADALRDKRRPAESRAPAAATGGAAMAAVVGMLLPLTRLIRAAEAMTEEDWRPIPLFREACHELDKAMEYARQVKAEGQAEPGEGGDSNERWKAIAENWITFARTVGKHVSCLYSVYPDGNGHIIDKVAAAVKERDGWQCRALDAERLVATHDRDYELSSAKLIAISLDANYKMACNERDDWRGRCERAEADYRTLANLVHRAAEILRTIVTDDEANIAALAALATAKVTTLEDRAKDADNDRDAAVRDTVEAQSDVVGWHGIFASVAAHLGCNARPTTAGNDHVIDRAKFASECITALWKIATSGDPEAGLDPHGYANRVIHPPMSDRGARGEGE